MRQWLASALLLLGVIDPIGDIGGFLAGGWTKLKDFAGQVWKSFRRLWTFVTGVFSHVGSAWQLLHGALKTLVSGLEELAEGTYRITRFLVRTLIPARIRHAVAAIGRLVYNKAKALFALARQQLRKAFLFLRARINDVLHFARTAIRVLRRTVNKAVNWIEHAGKRTADLVLHPKRLVTWILPHLVTPLARWILKHLAALATLMLRYFLQNVGKFARDIETAISRIF